MDDDEVLAAVLAMETPQGEQEAHGKPQEQPDNDESVVTLPADFEIDVILKKLVFPNPETKEQTENNRLCEILLKEKMVDMNNLLSDVWQQLHLGYKSGESSNVSNRDITDFYSKLYQYQASEPFRRNICKLFATDEQSMTCHHYNIVFKLIQEVRRHFIFVKARPYLEKTSEPQTGKIFENSDAGRGKIRYIGGWAVATLRHKKMQHIRANMYSKTAVNSVKKNLSEVKILERLEEDENSLFDISTDKASLEATKRKQNMRNGLTNISDTALNFFKSLDNKIRFLESPGNLSIHGSEFYIFLSDKILEDVDLKQMWSNIFQDEEPQHETKNFAQDISEKYDPRDILDIYREITAKFIRMSSAQFRREFIIQTKVEKHDAHRKQIQMGSKKVVKDIFSYETIIKDKSKYKESSHKRLQSEILKSENETFLQDTFKKTELQTLCQAYEVAYVSNMNKADLASMLKAVIVNVESVPNPQAMPSEGVINPPVMRSVESIQEAIVDEIDDADQPEQSRRSLRKKNKGPAKKKVKKAEYPCGVCSNNCVENVICCDKCEKWHHASCVNLKSKDLEFMGEDTWFCEKCNKS